MPNSEKAILQWGAQLQGETGGIAHHYFYRCVFENALRGDPRALYPRDAGHGFRFNGSCRGLVFEECAFRNNGGYGVQFGGPNLDTMTFLGCVFTNNRQGCVTGLSPDKTVDFRDCEVGGDKVGPWPVTKAFSEPAPVADFRLPEVVHTGVAEQAVHGRRK